MIGLLLIGGFIVSCLATACILSLAKHWQLIDIPNQRSSHQQPTPRGGGLGFVLGFFAILPLGIYFAFQPIYPTLVISGLAALIALIGFWDDKCSLSARLRLSLHILSCALLLIFLGGMPPLPLFGMVWPAGLVLNALVLLTLVWLLNLYNFMDGIDGLASLEAITVCAAMAVIYYFQGESNLLFSPLLLIATVSGFLIWNFPPARIFMGDAGSGFLGLCIGGLALLGAQSNPNYWWCWLIVLGVFVVDASMTLIRRALAGEAVMMAHRSHAYQYAARQLKSHKTVSLAVALINLGWLFPCAFLVASKNLSGSTGLIIAYTPLIGLAWWFKAGVKED